MQPSGAQTTAPPAFRAGALARIVAAHTPKPVAPPDHSVTLTQGWARALRLAAGPHPALGLSIQQASAGICDALPEAVAALPETGILVALEGADGARGLIALSHGLLDALIEVQATGRVDAQDIAPRPVTRIDEMLARDFLDMALAGFAREAQVPKPTWPERMQYGGVVSDRTRVSLLLPEGRYHVLQAEVGFDAVPGRSGMASLMMPMRAPPQVDPDTDPSPSKEATLATWRARLVAAVGDASLPLMAVLLRVTRPLGEVEALAPGYIIAFDPQDLMSVALETPQGKGVCVGQLGQRSGRRALRLAAPPASPKRPAPPSLRADDPSPPTHAPPPVPDPATSAPRNDVTPGLPARAASVNRAEAAVPADPPGGPSP